MREAKEVEPGRAFERELWTHAHGNLLGMLCLVFGALGVQLGGDVRSRARVTRLPVVGAVGMPLGFLLGGVACAEGDPSLGIVLVPAAGLVLLAALPLAARASWRAEATEAR